MDSVFNEKTNIRIKNVHFDGVKKTNARILAKVVGPIYEAKTIEQCIDKLSIVKGKLNSLNAFKNVFIELSQSPKQASSSNLEHNDVDVTFSVEENNFIIGGLETSVDDRRAASVSIKVTLPNLTGGGDSLGTELRACSGKTLGEVHYSRIYAPWWNIGSPRHTTSIYLSDYNSLSSGYNQRDRGVSTQVGMNIAENLYHSLSFDNVFRDIKCSEFDTPFKIREQSGLSFKTSAKYTIIHDNRDVPTFSTAGHMIRMSLERAGLFRLGNIDFTRGDMQVQVNQPIVPKLDISYQGSLQFGLIHPHPGNYLICDKYFAGGPLTIRGFKLNGVGPHSDHYALGARAFWSIGHHIYTRLPFVSSKSALNNHIRPHVFVNAGNAVDFEFSNSLEGDLKRLASEARYSYGIGLVFYFSSIRLELNYCVPKKYQRGDQTEEGFQYGLGVSFT